MTDFVPPWQLSPATTVSPFDLVAVGQQALDGSWTSRSLAVPQLAAAVAAALALAPLGSLTLEGGATITGGNPDPSGTSPLGSLYIQAGVGPYWSRGDGTFYADVDPAAVALTGGAIDGVAIGQTTPAAAAFTTLSAGASSLSLTGGSVTGNVALGNGTGGRITPLSYLSRLDLQATLNPTSGTQLINYFQGNTTFDATNAGPIVNHQSELRVNGTLVAPAGWHGVASKPNVWMLGSGAVPGLTASQPTSTVSNGTISGNLYGNVPFQAINNGTVGTYIANSSGNAAGLTGSGTFTDTVQYDGEDWSAGSATIAGVRYFLRGKDAGAISSFAGPITGWGSNGGLRFRLNGNGSFVLRTGTGTRDASGIGAIDLQTGTFTDSTWVASGQGAIALGINHRVPGLSSFAAGGGHDLPGAYAGAIGLGNQIAINATASMAFGRQLILFGDGSLAHGKLAFDRGMSGVIVQANGYFATIGDAQDRKGVLRINTASTASAKLTTDGGAASTTNGVSNFLNMPNFSSALVTIHVVGRDTVTGDRAGWICTALVNRGANAAATTVDGSPTWTAISPSAGWSSHTAPSLVSDTSLGGVHPQVTPINSNACRYVARVVSVEVMN